MIVAVQYYHQYHGKQKKLMMFALVVLNTELHSI